MRLIHLPAVLALLGFNEISIAQKSDLDFDGVQDIHDCDPTDPNVYPGHPEICDGIDNNCNDEVDEGFDVDADGIADCFDEESCDGVDNNADGEVDEGFDDNDGDGTADCIDVEECDGVDNDGDGAVDEGFADDNGDGQADCLDPPTCDGMGMTWELRSHDPVLGVDRVGCSTATGCSPYNGDTPCTEARPILCLLQDGSLNPGLTTGYYNGWAQGYIALTVTIFGCDLTSLSAANQFCEDAFGAGWRMGEFHDGGGG